MKRFAMAAMLAALAGVLAGCASNGDSAQHDAKIVRGITASMSSSANNFPANIPR